MKKLTEVEFYDRLNKIDKPKPECPLDMAALCLLVVYVFVFGLVSGYFLGGM